MQPITRGSAQSFCRTCLQDLTAGTGEYHIYQEKSLDVWLQATTDKKLTSRQIQYFPNKLCSACYIKAKVYYEYKQKTYCAGEVVKQVAEEQKDNEMIMTKLANVCRICLNTVQTNRAINIFENKPVLGWLNATSEVKLEETKDIAKWICSKCARKVHINLEFKVLVAQSLEYLKGILELSDEPETLNAKQVLVDELEEEEEETITVPLPNNDKPKNDNENFPLDAIKEENYDDYEFIGKYEHKHIEDSSDSQVFTEQFPLLKCEVEINIDEQLVKEEQDEHEEEPEPTASFDGDSKEFTSDEQVCKEEKLRRPRKKRKKLYATDSESAVEEEEEDEPVIKTRKKRKQPVEEDDCKPQKITITAVNLSSKDREVKRDFKYNCAECARRFSVQWIYEGHMRTHQGDTKPYQCPHCSKKYGQQSQLYRHLYDVHDVPQKPRVPAAVSAQIEYKCEFCCKIFKRQDHYRDHVDSVHHLIRRFKCSYCERSFSLARTMRLHEMRHTGECPYVCETCGRRFRKTTDLKLHMHKHMFPPELICSICHRGKNTPEELAAHVAEHEFKMRHQCPKCGMLFKRASHLVQHDKAVHLKIRPFKCRYCDKAFALHGTTLAHERVHTGERPQICNVCGVTYKTKRGLQAHIKRHEAEDDPKAPIPKGRRKERKKKNMPDNMNVPLPTPVHLNQNC